MAVDSTNDRNHLLDDYFRQYRTMVIRNAYTIVKEYHTAEDICQDTFMCLAEHLNEIVQEKVKIWLLVVSRHLALDHIKKGGKYRTDMSLEISGEFFPDIYSDPSIILENKEQCKEKENVLKSLKFIKPKWFDVILMSFVEEMDNPSIASEMGVTPGLVSQWKGRAVKWLTREYRKKEEEVS